jgi:hypothetical protein
MFLVAVGTGRSQPEQHEGHLMPEHPGPDPRPTHTTVDPSIVAKLPLPSHVTVWADGRWRRGWLIARSHEPTGWIGLVQYDNDHGTEVTEYVTADRIAHPDCWLPDD